MKRFIIIAMLTAIMPLAAMAQHEEDTENGVVSLAGREGFTPDFQFLTPYSDSPERLSIKYLSTFP